MINKIIKALKGVTFKEAWNTARKNKLRYFNWTDAKGKTRMYNSKAAGNDIEYLNFIDNMNEMSAQLPKTDNIPLHLGWEITKNKTSTELRNNDKFLPSRGTDTTIGEIVVTGNNKSLNKPKQKSNKVSDRIKIKDVVYSRGIASGVPLNGSLNGIFILGNGIFRKRLVNGLYVTEPIGKVYNGQQYYDERIFGLPNLYSTSFDNDGILRYDEYFRLSGMNKNKFLGRDSFTGNATAEVKTLPTIEYMIQNVPWYQNTDRIIHRKKSGGIIKKVQTGEIEVKSAK